MAAKPPKPPATFLKQNSQNSNGDTGNTTNHASNNNNNDPSPSTAIAATTFTTPASATSSPLPFVADTFSKLGIRRYNSRDNLLNNISNDNNNSTDTAAEEGAAARPTCNCTNISIMHLFHEMKQDFPTIPDQIVAHCVNENCHQRENCIQVLRNELTLNPIPAQTYPAKVLQQHHINQQQQQKRQQRQNSPQQLPQSPPHPHPQPPQRHKNTTQVTQNPTPPLRPIRAAPTQPPSRTLPRVRADAKHCPVTPHTNCDSVDLVQNNNNNNNTTNGNWLKDVSSAQSSCNTHSNNNNNNAGECASETCEMPATATINANSNVGVDYARSSDFIAALNKVAITPPSQTLLTATRPRARPNTLDLHTSQQQLQRQQLNKQLQQHLQQRSQLQQHQHCATPRNAEDQPQQKPIRKAPLPPIAPKPVFHSNQNQYNYNNNNSCGNSPQSQSGGSYSAESNLTSPISSCGDNEISANVVGLPSQNFAPSLINNNNNSHTCAASTTAAYQQKKSSPLNSPIRHCSVITVQPSPPYARDFLPPSKIAGTSAISNSNIANSGGSTPTSQKSFTSVNLTLRQPTAAVPQSTIDISAGPALSGNGSGLTYSSISYDARRGYQQNFHITVTDEGGVFNASRIRPRNCNYYASVEEEDSPGGPTGGGKQVVSATQQAAYMLAQGIAPPTNQSAAKTSPTTTTATREEMCVPLENSAFTETIKRQKTRRDKLATALRENKRKLDHVAEEIDMISQPLMASESERLDYEIEELRNDCQQMLNEIENIRRYGQLTEAERRQLPQQQEPPFPDQRSAAPCEVDFQQQQQNNAGSAVGGVVGSNGRNSAAGTPNSPHLLHQRTEYTVNQPPPPSYQPPYTDEDEYSDSNTDGGDDDEQLERWPCSMCTFLNHPQLNICEACECVRILPGTVRIVPTASGTAAAAATLPPPPTSFTGNTSATAAAAAAALAAAAPAAIAHRTGGASDDGAASGSNGRSPTSAATAAAARPVAAE